ncbi:hypothetical protein [Rufibacter psychrotolerans]|uniref:hypothetical protein n=1 Tax=Rufibacter psychrotolerans TaxID=2812556 RepID=UPI001966E242|nr:hypothetical protein [Rufibacter sp. SYSU D00308]
MSYLHKLLPTDLRKRKWLSVAVALALAGPLTIWGIYGIGEYGIALFIITPLLLGSASTIVFGYNRAVSYRESRTVAFITLLIFTLALLVFAIEGVICIVMAAPLALLLTWLGSFLGHEAVAKTPTGASVIILALTAAIPSLAFVEHDAAPQLSSVVTSLVIDASPETVWENVVAFPELEEPTELIFKTGIAYPINATIKGTGVGAVRHCNFTTGSFVEPITVWNRPKLLKFKVVNQPAPMKEISFWDIDAPHLHDYFVSTQGQFKLTALPNGQTKLEGTTWYYHNIKPAFYWRPWSNYIIHEIHKRVLTHIKVNSEKE